MRISIIADCHLNKVIFSSFKDKDSGIPYKSHDFMKAFTYMIDKNINEIKPDLLVIAGDIYDTHDPSNNVRAFFYKELSKLTENNIPVILLVGNHDICKKSHALSPIKEMRIKNIKVIEEPKFIKFKDHILLLYPYSISVERSIISNRDLFIEFVKESKQKIKDDVSLQNSPVLFFGHFGVNGAALRKGETDFVNSNSEDISINDIDSIGSPYVFLGDYHAHQVLPTKCVAMYTGSVEKDDITHKDTKKGFVVYDTEYEFDKVYGQTKFIEYPHCRPMISLTGSLKQILDGVEEITEDQANASVKIVYEGDSKNAREYYLALDGIKEKIKNKINPVHMFDAQKITNSLIEDKGREIEQKIIETGHMTEDEVMDVIEDILKEKNTVEEFDILFKMAKEIRTESKEVAK